MENMNNQGKRQEQYKDALLGAFMGWVGILLFCLIALLFTGCMGTYYISDAEYSDLRESHASISYHNNLIYWGWDSGYYYYYGKPHYYPWYYYYNTCPPFNYNVTTHIIVHTMVDRPTHRPKGLAIPPKFNRPKTNPTKVNINTNRNQVIIKNNDRSKRTNKTTIKRKSKK
jgi:hypothetical protein